MPKITPFLWFDDNAEEAVSFYASIFPNSRILSVHRSGEGGAGPGGKVTYATFELAGQRLMALNGGPMYRFTEAISLYVDVANQAELDEIWNRLLEGGRAQRCGWLKDKFGLSWQIIPSVLGELMGGKDKEKSKRVVEAMMQMVKLDIEKLKNA
jgi:predicted 3-demethylubiquinone-9 3-methyltransferase (glyoxalase superfamily)